MRRSLRYTLVGAWIVIASLGLMRWWILHPKTFPPLPGVLWMWLFDWIKPSCCEGAADVEALVVLLTATIVVVAVTFAGWLIWRKVQRRA